MRKLLYISIVIGLIIFLAAIAHYQWRSHELRGSIARVPDRTGAAQDASIETPIASTHTPSFETEVAANPKAPVMDVGSAADYEDYKAAFRKFDELYDAFQKEVAAFHEEYERSEEMLARDTPAKRRSAELQPLLAKAEAASKPNQRGKNVLAHRDQVKWQTRIHQRFPLGVDRLGGVLSAYKFGSLLPEIVLLLENINESLALTCGDGTSNAKRVFCNYSRFFGQTSFWKVPSVSQQNPVQNNHRYQFRVNLAQNSPGFVATPRVNLVIA